MAQRKIGIILEFGFHELKKYIYSGFAAEISKHFDIIWLAIQKNSEEFHKIFSDTGYPIIYFEQKDFKNASRIESINISVRRAWMSRKKLGHFHNYRTINVSKIKEILLGNNFSKSVFEKISLKLVYKRYYNHTLESCFENYNIQLILGTGYTSSFSKTVFVTANKNMLPTYLLINNWKDLYINNFIPFTFLTTIFSWDENMKNDLIKHMPYLKHKKIVISGNPVFDSLRRSTPSKDRNYYAKKYGIDANAEWLYYTMMSPMAGIEEIEIVKLIGNEIGKQYKKTKKVILLRKNPQHTKEDFINEALPENVILTEHYSFFDKAKDMHIQTPEGEQEWIDLLHHCALNLSVPSTVTLEFLTLGKPVINIGFGPDGKPDERLKQHFEAGFYKPLFNNEKVKKVEIIGDLLKTINNCRKYFNSNKINTIQPIASEIIIAILSENHSK